MEVGGKKGGPMASMNIVPLIDILLVLLIIFMVIVPVTPRGEAAQVPQPSKALAPDPKDAVVVSVLHSGGERIAYRINREDIAKADLPARLTAIYRNRAYRVLFVKGDDDVNFAQIAELIDIGYSAGVDRVGLITPKSATGL
jgi:biopolymer transport protein ExbD